MSTEKKNISKSKRMKASSDELKRVSERVSECGRRVPAVWLNHRSNSGE